MHRLLLIALLGCGRIAFEPVGDGGSDAGDGGIPIALALPAGGQFDRVTPSNDGIWYALSRTGGVYRSEDGMTWTPCAPRAAVGIAVDPSNTVWVAGQTIGRSTDRCRTWINTPAPRFSENVVEVRGRLFALLDNGIVEWTGAWTPIPTSLDGSRVYALTATSSAFIAATTGGITRSTDGVTWTTVTQGLPTQVVTDVVAGPTRAYAITAANATSAGGIACAQTDATVWSTCATPGGFQLWVDYGDDQRALGAIYDDLVMTTNTFANTARNLREMAGLDQGLVMDLESSLAGVIYAATTRGVFVSPASGPLAFEPRFTGLDAWDIDVMLRDGDDTYLGTRGGVLHSAAGAPFTISTTGFKENTTVRALAVHDGVLYALGRHIYRSFDRGATWESTWDLFDTDSYQATSIQFVGDRAYVGTGKRILVGDPPYTTFVERRVIAGDLFVNAVRVIGGELWAGTVNGLYRSVDDGMTFTMILPGHVRAITELADGGLAVSLLNGVRISDATRATFAPNTLFRNVTNILQVADTLVATTEAGVEYSKDRGQTWQPVPGVENASASAALYDGTLVVGTNSGLVRVALP